MKRYLVALLVLAVCFLFLCAKSFFMTVFTPDDILIARTGTAVFSGFLAAFNAFAVFVIGKKLNRELTDK